MPKLSAEDQPVHPAPASPPRPVRPRKCDRKVAIGDRFGSLEVIADPYREQRPTHTRTVVPCRCHCGKEPHVSWQELWNGQTSCGCDKGRKIGDKLRVHGHSRGKLHAVWATMKARCSNPNSTSYPGYGGKGVAVCEEWRSDYRSFHEWAMANGYRDGLSLDRRDNSRGYEPTNCRWATRTMQSRNRGVAVLLTAFGETKNASAWVEDPRCRVNSGTLRARLELEWHPEDAITTPPRGVRRLATAIRREIAHHSCVISEAEIRDEVWREIGDWPGYAVSDLGRIRSSRRGKARILKPVAVEGRCPHITLCPPGKRGRFQLSHLVLMAFVGPRPDRMEACHFPDPNPANCRLNNIRWDTHTENRHDMRRLNALLIRMTSDLASADD